MDKAIMTASAKNTSSATSKKDSASGKNTSDAANFTQNNAKQSMDESVIDSSGVSSDQSEKAEAAASAKNTVDYTAIIQELKAEIENYKDQNLRAAAEVQNIRRISDNEIAKAKAYGVESFAKDLTSVLDNLYRASELLTDDITGDNPLLKNIKEGIELTKREFHTSLERQAVRRIDPKNEKFDPQYHQALTQIPSADIEPGTVVDVIQAGYIIKDRLLKAAQVVVSKAPDA
jgi:molecular chaperone GrpE